jgi:anti-anti-sigma factor
MNVKLDTKEKFTVITPMEAHLTAIMSVEFLDQLRSFLQRPLPHIILNAGNIETIDETTLLSIVQIQEEFKKNNCSFVICKLNDHILKTLEQQDLTEHMNITPTESEAWDIVQMEEIEREILGDFDV